MTESNPPQKKTPIEYISESESSDEELNQHLHTSQEERLYDTIKGSVQATQAALAYTMAQCKAALAYMLCHQDGGRSQGDTRHSMPPARRRGGFNLDV